ncbi:MAG: aldehyde dehydrogenase family protein, partial [Gammaproteobacteria bacterium]
MSLAITSLQPHTKGAQAFLARAAQRMLIGGEWVRAASGETLDTLNPATGEVLGKIPAGAEADIDRAVAAARKALTDPSWRELTPSARSRLRWRMAELLEAKLDERAELESRDNRKPRGGGQYAA